MGGLTKDGMNLNTEDTLQLMPREAYREVMLRAAVRLPPLALDPHDLYEALFSEEELQWIKSQLRKVPI